MRLKHIKLSGFKSFVDSTSVPFPQQMTAVVGPNGCGKSNVIDAVRWVLGESSAKNLRGDAMTDVIFNGSSQRKPVSQASVELMFENTQGRLAGGMADRSEISIKRIVTREAQSNYYLNGSKCRRRDITDIFLGTGLGPRSYAIIEQGMISRLIESKPQELRVFIEEAAGISKYKERRRETENRIKHTRENLDRLADVREELGKNIEKLKRQASAAQRYKELKAQERKLKAQLTSIKWLYYSTKLSALDQQLQQRLTELEKYQSQELGDQRVLLELKQQAQDSRAELERVQATFYQLGSSISRLEQQILSQRQHQQTLSAQLQTAKTTLAQAQHYMQAELDQQQELSQQLEQDEPEQALVEEQLAELSEQLQLMEDQQQAQLHAQQQWQQQQFRLQQQQQQAQLKQQNIQQQLRQYTQAQQQLEHELTELAIVPLQQQLAQLTSNYADLQQQLSLAQQQCDTARQQLQHSEALCQPLREQQQHLSNELLLLEREQQRLQQLQQQQTGQQLLAQLKVKTGWANAVGLVLGQLQHARIEADMPSTIGSVVCTNTATPVPGSLSEVIVEGVYPECFNHIMLCPSIEQAQAQRLQMPGTNTAQSFITPQGYWLGSNWALQAGAEQQDNYLARTERLSELAQEQETQQSALTALQTQLSAELLLQQQAETALQQALQQASTLERQAQQLHTTVLLQQQELQQAEKQQVKLQAAIEQYALQQAQAEEMLLQLEIELESALDALMQHETEQVDLDRASGQQQLQLQQLKAQYEQKRTLLQQLITQVKLTAQQLTSVQQNIKRAQAQQQQLQEQVQQITLQLEQDDAPEILLQEQLQQALLERQDAEQLMVTQQETVAAVEQRIRELEQGQHGVLQVVNKKRSEIEDLRLDSEGYRVRANNMLELLREQQVNMKDILAELPADAEEALWQQQLDKTVEAVGRLGPINLAAIEEYEQQAERKQYLDAQNDDLTSAMDTLETAIRKIDKETRQKFKETFEQVNDGLKTLFPKVFGGGSAYLALTEDDMLETGVTIMARPPGKKNSTIHLLSGGEKALTALSLVFSIFRLNPAPFCMLDEVDAPLDDANVGRFCNLVREMSETVQFIYISHNKIAMEMAAQLMGVTMQEPGVSRVVAVDVDDAVKMAAAS
ncbi:AAA family ATPase [Rheinheimera baltica]|uniref:AAA family ATPase n=1 Tax=Rheinheimera baltica TaxID=67576 RepID=UPI00273DBD08|nr:AAA family ATPase [Rheinheimera baltica]MDP5191259.1 AAA family ATPase [Rheinheimera baltica]